MTKPFWGGTAYLTIVEIPKGLVAYRMAMRQMCLLKRIHFTSLLAYNICCLYNRTWVQKFSALSLDEDISNQVTQSIKHQKSTLE